MAEEKDPKARTDKQILDEAKERLKACIDDYSDERRKQKDDLLFSTLEQWPASIRQQREGDPNGPRPCLTIDQINQYIVQVVNDERQNKPAVKARPVDDQADIETAEVMQGIIRQIEDQSVAQVAYMSAGESAVRVGEGYFRILTEYEDEKSFNQVIRIKRVPDMFNVYLGPHMMPDGSDAEWGFVFEDLPLETFKRLYPGKKYHATDFSELENKNQYWGDDERVRVCEYFYFDYTPAELVFTVDGRSLLRSEYDQLPEQPEISDSRATRTRSTRWCKLTALEILDKRDWAGKYIPIVKVIGKEAVIDGKKSCWGLVRPAKDSLRMYNYVASTIVEKFALAPKAPFIGAKGQFEGFEDRWGLANTRNFAYLEYNPMSIDGLSVPAPQRSQPAAMEAALYQFLQTCREDVQASLGMFKASLGKEQPNQSGKAILALTRESDTGTFHFSDNLAISIMHGGRILIDLIPKIYDTARVLKILGEDGKVQSAQIDPNQPQAMREVRDLRGGIQRIHNLNLGTYDVTVSVGPSYNTKRMEAATMFTDLANTAKDPVSGTLMRYLAIKNSDIPGSDHAAEMMEKLLPPGLIKQEGQPEIPPQVAMQIQQMQQKMQEMNQENIQLKADAAPKMAKVEADHQAKMTEIQATQQAEGQKLQVDSQSQAEKLRLDREKADAEITLKRQVAAAEQELKQFELQMEQQLKKQEMEFEQAHKKEELAFQKECEKNDTDEKELPGIAKTIETGFAAAMSELGKILQESMKLNREILAQNSKPRKVTVTKADGSHLSADVRTLN